VTKKDYVLIGAALKPLTRDPLTANAMPTVIGVLCRAFQSDNMAFKTGLFMDYVNGACGPSGGRVHEREDQG